MTIYKATIHIFVDTEDEAEACDCISEALRPLLRRFADDYGSAIIDWRYTDDGRTFADPVEATPAEIADLEGVEQCPQCEGKDAACLYCKGAGTVTEDSADEWRRQNRTDDDAEPDSPCKTA